MNKAALSREKLALNASRSSFTTPDPLVADICSVLMSPVRREQPWHKDEHASIRADMCALIMNIINQRNQLPADKSMDIAKLIEIRLYHVGRSFDEYKDMASLNNRVKGLVVELLREAKTTHKQPGTVRFHAAAEQGVITQSGSPITVEGDLERSDTLVDPGSPSAAAKQVCSQGCSRIFIIKVLDRLLEHVQSKFSLNLLNCKHELILQWYAEVRKEIALQKDNAGGILEEEEQFGGCKFVESEPSTHWTEATQFFTWWKNNIERRRKLAIMQTESQYCGGDERKQQRAKWYKAIIMRVESIKACSGMSAIRSGNVFAQRVGTENTTLPTETDSEGNDANGPPGSETLHSVSTLITPLTNAPTLPLAAPTRGGTHASSILPTLPISLAYNAKSNPQGRYNNFVLLLFRALSDESLSSIKWESEVGAPAPHSFVIQCSAFLSEVLAIYFPGLSIGGFQNQMHMHGFTVVAVKSSAEGGANQRLRCFHSLLLRGAQASADELQRHYNTSLHNNAGHGRGGETQGQSRGSVNPPVSHGSSPSSSVSEKEGLVSQTAPLPVPAALAPSAPQQQSSQMSPLAKVVEEQSQTDKAPGQPQTCTSSDAAGFKLESLPNPLPFATAAAVSANGGIQNAPTIASLASFPSASSTTGSLPFVPATNLYPGMGMPAVNPIQALSSMQSTWQSMQAALQQGLVKNPLEMSLLMMNMNLYAALWNASLCNPLVANQLLQNSFSAPGAHAMNGASTFQALGNMAMHPLMMNPQLAPYMMNATGSPYAGYTPSGYPSQFHALNVSLSTEPVGDPTRASKSSRQGTQGTEDGAYAEEDGEDDEEDEQEDEDGRGGGGGGARGARKGTVAGASREESRRRKSRAKPSHALQHLGSGATNVYSKAYKVNRRRKTDAESDDEVAAAEPVVDPIVKYSRPVRRAIDENRKKQGKRQIGAANAGATGAGKRPGRRQRSNPALMEGEEAESPLDSDSSLESVSEHSQDVVESMSMYDCDTIDLSQPRGRRVYVDMTHRDKNEDDIAEGMVKGVFHGKLVTRAAQRSLPSTAGDASERHKSKYNNEFGPHTSRVGEEYQATIPALQAHLPHREAIVYRSNRVWDPSLCTKACASNLAMLKEKGRVQPEAIRLGDMYIVRHSRQNVERRKVNVFKYSLCTVVRAVERKVWKSEDGEDDESDSVPGIKDEDSKGTLQYVVMVYDGDCELEVPVSQLLLVHSLPEDHLLNHLHAKPQAVDLLEAMESDPFQSVYNNAIPASGKPSRWAWREVRTFCTAIRRYNDNVYKVWKMYFAEDRPLQHVLDFYYRIYCTFLSNRGVHTQKVFQRADHLLHRAQGPRDASDGEEDEEDDDEEEEENEEDEDEGGEEAEGESRGAKAGREEDEDGEEEEEEDDDDEDEEGAKSLVSESLTAESERNGQSLSSAAPPSMPLAVVRRGRGRPKTTTVIDLQPVLGSKSREKPLRAKAEAPSTVEVAQLHQLFQMAHPTPSSKGGRRGRRPAASLTALSLLGEEVNREDKDDEEEDEGEEEEEDEEEGEGEVKQEGEEGEGDGSVRRTPRRGRPARRESDSGGDNVAGSPPMRRSTRSSTTDLVEPGPLSHRRKRKSEGDAHRSDSPVRDRQGKAAEREAVAIKKEVDGAQSEPPRGRGRRPVRVHPEAAEDGIASVTGVLASSSSPLPYPPAPAPPAAGPPQRSSWPPGHPPKRRGRKPRAWLLEQAAIVHAAHEASASSRTRLGSQKEGPQPPPPRRGGEGHGGQSDRRAQPCTPSRPRYAPLRTYLAELRFLHVHGLPPRSSVPLADAASPSPALLSAPGGPLAAAPAKRRGPSGRRIPVESPLTLQAAPPLSAVSKPSHVHFAVTLSEGHYGFPTVKPAPIPRTQLLVCFCLKPVNLNDRFLRCQDGSACNQLVHLGCVEMRTTTEAKLRSNYVHYTCPACVQSQQDGRRGKKRRMD